MLRTGPRSRAVASHTPADPSAAATTAATTAAATSSRARRGSGRACSPHHLGFALETVVVGVSRVARRGRARGIEGAVGEAARHPAALPPCLAVGLAVGLADRVGCRVAPDRPFRPLSGATGIVVATEGSP